MPGTPSITTQKFNQLIRRINTAFATGNEDDYMSERNGLDNVVASINGQNNNPPTGFQLNNNGPRYNTVREFMVGQPELAHDVLLALNHGVQFQLTHNPGHNFDNDPRAQALGSMVAEIRNSEGRIDHHFSTAQDNETGNGRANAVRAINDLRNGSEVTINDRSYRSLNEFVQAQPALAADIDIVLRNSATPLTDNELQASRALQDAMRAPPPRQGAALATDAPAVASNQPAGTTDSLVSALQRAGSSVMAAVESIRNNPSQTFQVVMDAVMPSGSSTAPGRQRANDHTPTV